MRAASLIAAIASAFVAIATVIYFIGPSTSVKTIDEVTEEMVADVSLDGPHAVVTVLPPGPTFDFGQMVLGDTEEHTFTVRNDGDDTLELKKLFNTCKCTLSNLEEAEVAPGETLDITLTYTPKAAEEEFSQGAIIGTNDPTRKELNLNVIGRVLRDVVILPTDVWSFGTLSEKADAPTKTSGAIVSGYQDDFQVLEVASAHPAIDVEISGPLEEAELADAGGKSGNMVTITIRPEVPVGRFSFPVRLKTNSTREPSKEVEIIVGGTRSGPFSILGAGWIGANSRLAMGRFKASEGKSQNMTMFIDKAETPIEFEVKSVVPPIANVTVARDDSYANERREKVGFTVEIPAGVTPGLYEDETDRVQVQLESNHPLFKEFNFEISFRAE